MSADSSPLAPLLVESIRRCRRLDIENADLTEQLVTARTQLQWCRELASATQDFNSWLMRRSRERTVDQVVEWRQELDRREAARRKVAA
jgi:hypothetical protein